MMKTKLGKKQNIFLRIALAAFLAWMVISLVQLQIDIGSKRSVLDDLNTQIANQQRTNEELANENANDDLYLDQQARDRGLAKPGESIYKEVPGS